MRIPLKEFSFFSFWTIGAIFFFHEKETAQFRKELDSAKETWNAHISSEIGGSISGMGGNMNDTDHSFRGPKSLDLGFESAQTVISTSPSLIQPSQVGINDAPVPSSFTSMRQNPNLNPMKETHPRMKPRSPSPNPVRSASNSLVSDDVEWCRSAQSKYRVVPGKSWGSLKGAPRVDWAKRGCDIVVATGRSFSCDEQWGRQYVQEWANHEEILCRKGETGDSTVTCRSHPATASKACIFENIVIDFSKAPVSHNSRSFAAGFLGGSCSSKRALPQNRPSGIPLPPGVALRSGTLPTCDLVVDTPSFFMSHDLIFNLGHTISDFWIVFTTMLALEQEFADYMLVNMDAIRGNGPAGRGSKIGWAGHPDWIGQGTFFQQYEKWFGHGLSRAIDFGSKKVCFKKAVFQAKPGPAHIWSSLESGKNSTTERCARDTGNSWLLRRYNTFNRVKWGLISEATALSHPRDAPTVTLIVRKGDNMRVFANENDVVSALKDLPGAGQFRAVDFSSISFHEQVELIHNTSLLIGMHGAALFHLLSMNLESPRCCGVIELYHKRWSQTQAVPTVMNMAKFLGLDYSVLRSSETESVESIRRRGKGTVVDTDALRELAVRAVSRLSTKV